MIQEPYLIPTMRLSVKTLLKSIKSFSKIVAAFCEAGSFPQTRTAYVSDPPTIKQITYIKKCNFWYPSFLIMKKSKMHRNDHKWLSVYITNTCKRDLRSQPKTHYKGFIKKDYIYLMLKNFNNYSEMEHSI